LKRVKNILYQNLTANKGGADFFIAGGADEKKFSLSGITLNFEATDFEARDDLSAVSSGNGDIHITNSCEGKLGSELIIDDFKISTGGGESQVSSNICIGSTESANQKVGTLVIGKSK
jgi:hypothetical protein